MIRLIKHFFKLKTTTKAHELLGTWKAVEFNNEAIQVLGFINVILKFKDDDLKVETQLNAFGGTAKTSSLGKWEMNSSNLETQFEENYIKSKVQFLDLNTIVFKPDPFFKSETASVSKYVRVNIKSF